MKTSVSVRLRCVRLETSRLGQAKPYRAKIVINGKPRDLGRYATREEGEAAFRGARKACPMQLRGRPPLSPEKREAVRETYRTVKSQPKTAAIHGVSLKTVQRILHEVRPKLEDYPDMAAELI
jgi:hypothetical protein